VHFVRLRSTLIVSTAMLASVGCTLPEMIDGLAWKQQFRQPFSTLNPEDESVAQVDIATVTWRRDQPMLKDGLWAELDEQFLTLDQRHQLAQHGLRIGLMRSAAGSRLQATLANPEYSKQGVEASREIVQQNLSLDGKKADLPKMSPVCQVETRRILNRNDQDVFWNVGQRGTTAKLVVPDVEKEYLTREVTELEQQFAIQMQKLPDGTTKLRVAPMIKCAITNNQQSNVFLESLKLKNAVSKLEQRYEKLAFEVTLTHDQYLVVTATPVERPIDPKAETWGELAFMQYPTDQQIVLIIRGASVVASKTPDAPKKGNAWPLAWQASEVQAPVVVNKPCGR
jgi:hypothetical protein